MPEPENVTHYKPVFSLLHQQLQAAILSKIQRWNWITGNNQALDYEIQNNSWRLWVWVPAFHTIIAPSSQDTITTFMALWSKRHDILLKQERTTGSQGFVHLAQRKFPSSWKWKRENHKRTVRNSGGHLHFETVKSGFEGLVSALSIWRGSLLSFYFVLFSQRSMAVSQ